jgi:hypothetical protein
MPQQRRRVEPPALGSVQIIGMDVLEHGRHVAADALE